MIELGTALFGGRGGRRSTVKGVHEPLEVAKKPSSVVRYFVRTV